MKQLSRLVKADQYLILVGGGNEGRHLRAKSGQVRTVPDDCSCYKISRGSDQRTRRNVNAT